MSWSDNSKLLLLGGAVALGAAGVVGFGVSYSRYRKLQQKAARENAEGESKVVKKKRGKKVKILSEEDVIEKLQAGMDSFNAANPKAPPTAEQKAAVDLALGMNPADFSPAVRYLAAKVLFAHHFLSTLRSADPADERERAEGIQETVRRAQELGSKIIALLDMDDSGLDEKSQEEAIGMQIEMGLPLYELKAVARALDKCRALASTRPGMSPNLHVWFIKASFIFGRFDEYLRAYHLVFGTSREAQQELQALHLASLEAPELQTDHLVLAELIRKRLAAGITFTPPPLEHIKPLRFNMREMKSTVKKYVDLSKPAETVESLREQMNTAGASWKPIEGGIVMRAIGCYVSTKALSPTQMPIYGFKNDEQLFLSNYVDSTSPSTGQTTRMMEEYDLQYQATEADTGYQIWQGTYRMAHDLPSRLAAGVAGYTPRTELIMDVAIKIQPMGVLAASALSEMGMEVLGGLSGDTSGLGEAAVSAASLLTQAGVEAADLPPPELPVD